MQVKKRSGEIVEYDIDKIENAVMKCFQGADNPNNKILPFEERDEREKQRMHVIAHRIAEDVTWQLENCEVYAGEDIVSVERIQDLVEIELAKVDITAAIAYAKFRLRRANIRQSDTTLMRQIGEIVSTPAVESDMKRSNANIDGDTSMGAMLQFGTTAAKAYNAANLLTPQQADAHRNGDIHIHDFDFYSLTTTCTQIDLLKLFHGGFNTGHGYLREPQSIGSYAALAAIAIQSNQNDQHGGQSIPAFDFAMAEGVRKSFLKVLKRRIAETIEEKTIFGDVSIDWDVLSEDDRIRVSQSKAAEVIQAVEMSLHSLQLNDMDSPRVHYLLGCEMATCCRPMLFDKEMAAEYTEIARFVCTHVLRDIKRETYQAMEGFIHNLNTMHSRAGAQTPFSSINYGTDTSPEGRLVIEQLLLAEDAGLGNGETPIFPIHIFKVKEGVNYNEGDPNFDLFKLSMKVSAKRLFPNYVFLDSPFNLQYYRPGHPETEVATMGCRTRVMGNVYDPSREIAYSRGNLSFTSINLPRLAIESQKNETVFFEKLQSMLELVAKQLLDRFEIQAKRKVRNYPFLMGQGVWLDSENLSIDDTVREVLKHGTLSIGFIGLAETLTALYGSHHGESDEAQKKGLQIVQYMRNFCDRKSQELRMNFTLLATPAEGLSGRFVRMDAERYGVIPGVTDRAYYTNSFHVPVWYPISAFQKIQIEAPYHALCNAGHISYVELDGDTANNVEAFESVVRCMHDAGIGYGSINHPVDRDPVCGYVGVIGDVCPRCGRREGEALTEEQLQRLKKMYPNAPVFVGHC